MARRLKSKSGLDLRLLGDKQLQRKLLKLERSAQGKAMKAAAKSAMEPVRDLAKQRVPVDTGRLQKSIRVGIARMKNKVGAVVSTGTRKQLKIKQDAKGYYPAVIEYGTKDRPAKSFLRSSLFDRRAAALGILRREIKKIVESV